MQLRWRNAGPLAAFILSMQWASVAQSSQTAEQPPGRADGGAEVSLEEIVVTAALRSVPVADLPQSVTVLAGVVSAIVMLPALRRLRPRMIEG